MTLQVLSNALVIIVLVGVIGIRQLNWRPIVVSRMWRFPAILAIVGVFLLAQSSGKTVLKPIDITVLVIEIVLSLGIGALMGKIAQLRPIEHPNTAAEHVATIESRTGWVGLCLWIALIVVRVGIDIFATQWGSQIATSTGVILILLAANRAARTGVFAYRIDRKVTVAA
jgi:hypothetical protein